MRIRFKEFLLGALLSLTLPIYADESSNLFLTLANGKTQVFDLDHNPVITFSDENVNIKSDNNSVSLSFDEIRHFSFWRFNLQDDDALFISDILSVILGKDDDAHKADVNGDGKVDIGDVLKYLSNKKTNN